MFSAKGNNAIFTFSEFGQNNFLNGKTSTGDIVVETSPRRIYTGYCNAFCDINSMIHCR